MLFNVCLTIIVSAEQMSLCLTMHEELIQQAQRLKCSWFYPGIFVLIVYIFALLTNVAIYKLIPYS